MTTDRDIKILLSLLQAEGGVDGTENGATSSSPEPTKSLGFFDRQRAMWADKVKLTELLEAEKGKVARLEQDKKELTQKCSRYKVELDFVKYEFEKLKAEIAKERATIAAETHAGLEAGRRSNKLAQERYERRLQAEREAEAQREANAARRAAEESARRESAEGARPAPRDEAEAERNRSDRRQDKEEREKNERVETEQEREKRERKEYWKYQRFGGGN